LSKPEKFHVETIEPSGITVCHMCMQKGQLAFNFWYCAL